MKLGIVGTGTIVEEVLPVLCEKTEISLSAICSTKRSEEKMHTLKERYHIAHGYTDYTELLASSACDTVYIALPNHLHYDYTRRALEAGKHVIVEKPITSHIGEANTLAALAKEKHLFLFRLFLRTLAAASTKYSGPFCIVIRPRNVTTFSLGLGGSTARSSGLSGVTALWTVVTFAGS